MQVQSFKLRGYQPVVGVLLKQGSARTLLQSSPADYVVDGYQLLARQAIASSGDWEQQLALVLTLKGAWPAVVPPYPVDSDYALFTLLRETQEVIAIYLREDSLLVGRVCHVNAASLRVHLLSTKGQWLEVHTFRFARIKLLETGTDYLHSLQLLATHNERLKARS
jgi:hypothetical protein